MIDPVINRYIETIKSYIEASRTVVKCRQNPERFHYACQSCEEYNRAMCPTYRSYVDAWIKLQKLVPENDSNFTKG
jgi:hypothetical protein